MGRGAARLSQTKLFVDVDEEGKKGKKENGRRDADVCGADIRLGDVNPCPTDPSLEFHSFLFSLSFRKSSSNGHHHHNPVDVSSSPTVAESKARFMREFSEENGSSLGLRDKKVRNGG